MRRSASGCRRGASNGRALSPQPRLLLIFAWYSRGLKVPSDRHTTNPAIDAAMLTASEVPARVPRVTPCEMAWCSAVLRESGRVNLHARRQIDLSVGVIKDHRTRLDFKNEPSLSRYSQLYRRNAWGSGRGSTNDSSGPTQRSASLSESGHS